MASNPIILIYKQLILEGKKTIEQVPEQIRQEVQELLNIEKEGN